MTNPTTRIAMVSGPRNISTTMLRAFENRPDTVAVDEPFYACYLKATGAAHPMRQEILAAQPAEWTDVVNQLAAPLPDGASIVVEKHIAFHFVDGAPLDWIRDCKVFHLIREPRAMIASYKNKYDDVAPIVDSLKIQRLIFDDCERRGVPCPIADSADILMDPEAMLRALCAALNIPFTNKMLSWPAGPRASDGVWAPHWYDAVLSSTGFRELNKNPVELMPVLEEIAEACLPDYQFFYERRLSPAKHGK